MFIPIHLPISNGETLKSVSWDELSDATSGDAGAKSKLSNRRQKTKAANVKQLTLRKMTQNPFQNAHFQALEINHEHSNCITYQFLYSFQV